MHASKFLWVLWLVSAPLLGLAQTYAINWFTIDGGGGISTNGQYTIADTVGQPDVAAMSGGTYTVQGGFWSFVAAVQTPGGPLLSISCSNGNVVVSWPAPADGWGLRYTSALTTNSVWISILPPYQTNALMNLWYTEPLSAGTRFFQLYKP